MISHVTQRNEGRVFRPSKAQRFLGQSIVIGSLLLIFLPGVWGIFDPTVRGDEEGPGVGIMMACGGLFFAAAGYAIVSANVKVDATGVRYRDQLWRKRWMPRGEIWKVVVAPSWAVGRDSIYLVPRDGKPVALPLMAYRTHWGSAWLETMQRGITTALAGDPEPQVHPVLPPR